MPVGRTPGHLRSLASERIEGFEPDAEFTADYAQLTAGTITGKEFRARVAARARRT
jgi:hypothetical protein